MPDVHALNTASRKRLRALAMWSDDELERALDVDWTVPALLAHLAFWDRMIMGRWKLATDRGDELPASISDDFTDLINAAQLPQWRAVSGRATLELAQTAAEVVDGFLEKLDSAHQRCLRGRLPTTRGSQQASRRAH